MSKEQGSREISLGPYRSTELALEERLNKKESKSLVSCISSVNFGKFDENSKFSSKDLVGMLSALGYQKDAECLYVRHEVSSDKFVYLESEERTLISGNFNGNNEYVLRDIDIIYDMYLSYLGNIFRNTSWKRTATDFFIGTSSAAIFTGVAYCLAYLALGNPAATGISLIVGLFGLMGGPAGAMEVRESRFNSKMAEKASYLSINAKNYSFGNEVYKQIVDEYCKLKILGDKPKQLETSEVAQLPESKEDKE